MGLIDQFAKHFARYLVDRSHQHHKTRHLFLASLLGSTLELVVIPSILVCMGHWLDNQLELGPLLPRRLAYLGSAACFSIGIPLLAWTIFLQHTTGRGTPLPLVPTKKLLTQGPYQYTRNPMTLGGILWLSGWALLTNSSIALIGGVGIFSLTVLAYIKLVEEKELALRFGRVYEEYSKKTPFLFPSLPF